MTESIAQRLLMSAAPVAISALIGSLVWGIKLDGRVSHLENQLTEMREREQQMNEQAQRIDALIALLKARDHSPP